ncbi:MAG: Ribosomal RNA small subunit methyltransferase Nep1 [Nitrosopumilales archaeon]|nr:MAG: Ribosomal RNA small subunit methyltransferase Nep1 [Nitrosopumilales archaeon]
MLSLILTESSLELVPKEIQNHKSVISHCQKLGKKPSEILLDNSWHFAAMKGIDNEIKRGRPDLVHFSLLEACSIPLFYEKKISVYVHTINDKVIFVGNDVRLPKSYHRFAGLIEKLYDEQFIQANGINLLEIKDMKFNQLIEKISPDRIVGLSTQGILSSCEDVAKKLTDNSCIIIGGFPKGHFSDSIRKKIEYLVNVNKKSLESHVIISRILYEYEKTIFM